MVTLIFVVHQSTIHGRYSIFAHSRAIALRGITRKLSGDKAAKILYLPCSYMILGKEGGGYGQKDIS
jgi:hypothetical protein